jgi:4-hydroxy-tetrahydrodipicolinate synthase
MLGENASLTQAERDAVVTAAREVVAGRVPMLSGLAELSTADARRAARNYARLGAEGLMVFPSLAYRTDRAETVAWYTAVAAEGLPVMIYNNPLAYRVDVDIPTLEGLAGIPGIVAIKEETGDIRRVTDLFNAFGDRFAIFCGVDDLILESLALGAVGWVSGMTNAWPAECVRLFDLARARDPAALVLYRLMTPAFHLDTDVKLVQYIKLAEHLVTGAPAGVRPPRLPLRGAEKARVEAVIRKTIAHLAGLA